MQKKFSTPCEIFSNELLLGSHRPLVIFCILSICQSTETDVLVPLRRRDQDHLNIKCCCPITLNYIPKLIRLWFSLEFFLSEMLGFVRSVLCSSVVPLCFFFLLLVILKFVSAIIFACLNTLQIWKLNVLLSTIGEF